MSARIAAQQEIGVKSLGVIDGEGEKICTKCGAAKPLTEFHAQRKAKSGKHPWCKVCNKERVAAWRAENPARARASSSDWRKRYPERAKMRDAAYYARTAERQRALAAKRRDPEKNRVTVATWRAADPDRARAANAKWRAENVEKCRAKKAARRAAKSEAIPVWFGELDRLVFIEAADLCRLRAAATGIPWDVDHIVPLRGKTVCGLHVASNAAVIPSLINNQKGNRVWPDQP